MSSPSPPRVTADFFGADGATDSTDELLGLAEYHDLFPGEESGASFGSPWSSPPRDGLAAQEDVVTAAASAEAGTGPAPADGLLADPPAAAAVPALAADALPFVDEEDEAAMGLVWPDGPDDDASAGGQPASLETTIEDSFELAVEDDDGDAEDSDYDPPAVLAEGEPLPGLYEPPGGPAILGLGLPDGPVQGLKVFVPDWVPQGDVHCGSTAHITEEFDKLIQDNYGRGFPLACRADDVTEARRYLKRLIMPYHLGRLDLEYGFALRYAVFCSSRGELKVVKFLLKHIAPEWARDMTTRASVVMIAARNGGTVLHRAKLIRLLLDHGDSIEVADDDETTAAHLMATAGIPLLPQSLLASTAATMRVSLSLRVLGRLGVAEPSLVPQCANLSSLVTRLVNSTIPLLGRLPDDLADQLHRPPVTDNVDRWSFLHGPVKSYRPFRMRNDSICMELPHACQYWREF